MTCFDCVEKAPQVVEAAARGETMELVRGQEQSFLERLMPVVECQSVLLDLGSVERIDAAGVAALIGLYCKSRNAGYSFAVRHPRRHVREVLFILGLERILLAGEETENMELNVA